RSAKKQHRRSMARIRRSSQTAVEIPSFESAGKKASRRASQVRRMSVKLKKKIRRRSSAAVLKRADVEKLKHMKATGGRRKSTVDMSD